MTLPGRRLGIDPALLEAFPELVHVELRERPLFLARELQRRLALLVAQEAGR